MNPYPSIPTVWNRDPATNHKTLIPDSWATLELEWLYSCDWIVTEKVDGMNIRLMFKTEDFSPHATMVTIAGRTDNAQIPQGLYAWVNSNGDRISTWCENNGLTEVCLYGEGYGHGIQKDGEKYANSQRFILFDVMINGCWQDFGNVKSIGREIGIQVVPEVGVGWLTEAIRLTNGGVHPSLLGDRPREGLVMRPPHELTDRKGNRIMCKVKAKDFR